VDLMAADGPGGTGRTELLADGPTEIRLRHHWDAADDPQKANVVVALPGTSHPQVEVRGWTLRDEETDEERRHSADDDDLPPALERLRPARIGAVGTIRHTRLANLELIPSRVTMDDRLWRIIGLEIALRFDESALTEASPERIADPLARPLVESLVINPEAVTRWALPEPPVPRTVIPAQWWPEPVADRWVKIETEHPGPVRVNLSDLTSAGVPRDQIDLGRIEVYHHGRATPLWIDPQGGGFIFVAPDLVEPHSARTAFWLDLEGQASLTRIAAVSSEPPSDEEESCHPWTEQIIEQDHPDAEIAVIEPTPRGLSHNRDRPENRRAVWIWETLAADEPVTVDLPSAPGPRGRRTASGEVALNLIVESGGRGGIDEIDLLFPSGKTRTVPLDSAARFRSQPSAVLPAESLFAGELTLVARGGVAPQARPSRRGSTGEITHLDSVVIRRPIASLRGTSTRQAPVTLVPPPQAGNRPATVRLPATVVAFDVGANPPVELRPAANRVLTLRGRQWRAVVGEREAFAKPVEITAWEPVDLRAPDHRADMVIITARELQSAADRLAEHHRAEGLATEVVLTEEIYDCHGEGVAGPQAIRAFLADAFRRWSPPAPLFVTLLGDCTRDHHGVFPDGVRNHVPSFSDPNLAARAVHWEASDLRHVQIAGEDGLADMLIGRLSARDSESAMALVEKVIAYGADPPPGPWRSRVGFIADDDRIGSVSFDEMCEEIRAQTMSASLPTETVYLRELPLSDNLLLPAEAIVDPLYEKVSREATTRIRDLFNSGHLISTYFGHGGPNIWADERIWFGCESPRSDNLRLSEERRLPFLINMTCSSGAIDFPTERLSVCISEDFLRSRGGAVACFVPTGEGLPSHHRRLTHWLMRAIFDQGLRRLGEITTMAGWRHVLEDRSSDLPEHFVLLGDPALALALPATVTRRDSPGPLRAGTDRTVAFDPSPTALDRASGVAWVNGPDGDTLETRDLRWEAGQPVEEIRFDLPADPPEGKWGLGALWWDEASGRDELIHTEFVVDRSRLALGRFGLSRDGGPVSEGQRTSVEVEIQCVAAVGTEPFTLALVDLADPPPRQPLATADLLLGPRESRSVTLEWAAEPGMHQLALEGIGADGMWTDESYLRLSEPTPLAVVAPETSAELVTTPAHVQAVLRPNGLDQIERLTVTVGNVGGRPAGAGMLTLRAGGRRGPLGDPVEIPPLAPGRLTDLSLDLRGAGSVRVGADLAARIDWSEPESGGEHRRSRAEVTLEPPRPDLVILPGQWQMRPESPSEGETIFLDCVVENRGSAAAVDAKIHLRDGQGRRLTNRTDSAIVTLPCVRPGQRRPVTLRWDPKDNAGDRTLHVWIEPSRTVHVTAGGQSSLAIDLRVRTGEDVMFTKVVRLREPQSDPLGVTLWTQIHNRGETEGRDQVITWYRDQERTVRLGESVIPVFAPGQYLDVEFLWIFSEEEIALQRQGVVLDPTCDLGVRASERRVKPPEETPAP
jgi:hypothetical protein